MPRRKPFSAKKRKQQIQEARAIQRGDNIPDTTKKNRGKGVGVKSKFQNSLPGNDASMVSSRRLQSRFIQVSQEYLETTRNLSFSVPLQRPIPDYQAIFDLDIVERGHELTCPARPKFRYDQSKKEVEKNEEGWFGKWLKNTEKIMSDWVETNSSDDSVKESEPSEDDVQGNDKGEGSSKTVKWPKSGSWYETNLEVWRQLWRVTESSQILLLLTDSRCPPLHCPPSLRAYVQNLKPRKEIILVLTKSDLVDPTALEGWKLWMKDWWGPEIQVVSVMSYDLELLRAGRSRHRPEIPRESLEDLIKALQIAHQRLSTPHPRVREDPEKLSRWKSPAREQIDWSILLPKGAAPILPHSQPAKSSSSDLNAKTLRSRESDDDENINDDEEEEAEEPLTIGLIGQPNVGKSSLLNALFGEQRVRASRTPGKTLFWGWKKEVKIVDCPGLVCPSLVGLELQALAGVLPISQIPSLPACIHYASTLLPLETIFRIPRPESEDVDTYASKKTWRGERPVQVELKETWTSGEMMEGRALDRGYLTAKGGRPDSNRAANGIMRNLADGRVRWGFWPPSSTPDRGGRGIWLGDDDGDGHEDVGEDEGSDEDEETERGIESAAEDDNMMLDGEKRVRFEGTEMEDEEDEDPDEEHDSASDDSTTGADSVKVNDGKVESRAGFFAALALDDETEEDDDDDDEEESDVDDANKDDKK